MGQHTEPAVAEVMVRGLLGAVDVDGGATPQQLALLGAVAAHLWGCGDVVPGVVAAGTALGPVATAAALPDAVDRRRFHEVLIALEVCRHPLSAAQVDRVEAYCDALAVDGPDRAMFRDLVRHGSERAAADYQRFLRANLAERTEPALGAPPAVTAPEPGLVARLRAFADLPSDSLGQAFLAFYERAGLVLPGVDATDMNHFYVAHDMAHVITGIEPTGPGEVALSAFLWAAEDDATNAGALLASLVVHEAGFGAAGALQAAEGQLGRPGAVELFGRELARGAACPTDPARTDHFALAALPLAEVRERLGVGPPVDPHDGHHHW